MGFPHRKTGASEVFLQLTRPTQGVHTGNDGPCDLMPFRVDFKYYQVQPVALWLTNDTTCICIKTVFEEGTATWRRCKIPPPALRRRPELPSMRG
jgi:hypothetical protein